MVCEIRAPATNADGGRFCVELRVAHRVEANVDAERVESSAGQRDGVASTAHRDVERAQTFAAWRREPRQPLGDERRQ